MFPKCFVTVFMGFLAASGDGSTEWGVGEGKLLLSRECSSACRLND